MSEQQTFTEDQIKSARRANLAGFVNQVMADPPRKQDGTVVALTAKQAAEYYEQGRVLQEKAEAMQKAAAAKSAANIEAIKKTIREKRTPAKT